MAASRSKKQKYPFLFYGHEPGDWAEGPQLWFIRFAKSPPDGVRGRMGVAAAELLDGGPLAIEWLQFSTSGPWAALGAEASDQDIFADAAKLLVALHDIAPIAEVILATAREPGCSGWDRWSGKQQALPSVFRGVVQPSGDLQVRIDTHMRTRGTDDDYPDRCEAAEPVAVQPSQTFDEAYRTRSDELFRAELEVELARAARSGKPALVPANPRAVRRPALTPDEAARIGTHGGFGRTADGRVVAAVRNDHWTADLAVLDPGADQARTVLVDRDIPTKYLHLSPGGNHLLLADKHDLLEIDLITGEREVVYQLPGHGSVAFSASYLDSDDRVLAQQHGEQATLMVRSATSRQLEPVSSAEVPGVNVVTVRGCLGFLADDRSMRVVGVDGQRIAFLGALKIKLGATVFEADRGDGPGIFVTREGKLYEIVNLERAFEEAFGKPLPRGA